MIQMADLLRPIHLSMYRSDLDGFRPIRTRESYQHWSGSFVVKDRKITVICENYYNNLDTKYELKIFIFLFKQIIFRLLYHFNGISRPNRGHLRVVLSLFTHQNYSQCFFLCILLTFFSATYI